MFVPGVVSVDFTSFLFFFASLLHFNQCLPPEQTGHKCEEQVTFG